MNFKIPPAGVQGQIIENGGVKSENGRKIKGSKKEGEEVRGGTLPAFTGNSCRELRASVVFMSKGRDVRCSELRHIKVKEFTLTAVLLLLSRENLCLRMETCDECYKYMLLTQTLESLGLKTRFSNFCRSSYCFFGKRAELTGYVDRLFFSKTSFLTAPLGKN